MKKHQYCWVPWDVYITFFLYKGSKWTHTYILSFQLHFPQSMLVIESFTTHGEDDYHRLTSALSVPCPTEMYLVLCTMIKWDSTACVCKNAHDEQGLKKLVMRCNKLRQLFLWLCHWRALIRSAGHQASTRRHQCRNTEERLEHKHLPHGRLLLHVTSWCRNSSTNTKILDTHTHKW